MKTMALTMTTTAATTGNTRLTLVKKYCKAFMNCSLLSTSDSSPGISRAGAMVPKDNNEERQDRPLKDSNDDQLLYHCQATSTTATCIQLTSSNCESGKFIFGHRKSGVVMGSDFEIVPCRRVQVQDDEIATGFDTR